MRLRRASSLVLLVLGLVASGCGEDEPKVFRVGSTEECLRQANVPVRTRNLDFVAANALGGGLHASFIGNAVTLAFGTSEEGARDIEQAYRRLRGETIVIDEVLMREGNVVMVWVGHPTPAQLDTVKACLDA